jgi:hypothetical protein
MISRAPPVDCFQCLAANGHQVGDMASAAELVAE